MMIKAIGILFGLVLLSFVAVQYNDPDPALWMAIYAIAALMSFMAAFGKVGPVVLLAAAALYLAGGIYMWPSQFEGISIGGGELKNIEEARESLGLFLCVAVFLALALLHKYAPSTKARI
ncbi:transmembrane 220 family protein [Pontibacter sp. CAU 1760]